MKRIYYILASLMLLMSASSCGEKWLEVQSHDQLFIDDYYNSEARIYEALVAAYDPLQWFDWNTESQYNPIPFVYDIMADDVYPGGADMQDNRHWHLMSDYSAEPVSGVCSALWMVAYSGINRSNAVHQYMPNVKNISDQTKAMFLAEATVLRAYYYNMLWKLWGNIPYYETNLGVPFLCEQSSAAQVYEKIALSLESVLDSEVLPMKRTDNAQIGRITYAAAAMLYAEVVMYQNDATRMQRVLDLMEKIITEGGYSLVTGADFLNMWEPAGEWSSESIFEINHYSQGATRNYDNPHTAGGTILPQLLGINGLSGDAKYTSGWGFGPMRADAAALFTDEDLRRQTTVYQPDPATYTPRYQNTGYFNAKYLPRKDGEAGMNGSANLNFNNNLRIYRYAETLLNAAELIARGYAGKGTAQDYLNQVRSRAGLGSIDATVDNILDERRLEFMGEGKRYWDLIRSGKAASVLTPANDPAGYRTRAWSESKKYLPIPQKEIDAAQGTLVQNNY